jgi:hypothetical protein
MGILGRSVVYFKGRAKLVGTYHFLFQGRSVPTGAELDPAKLLLPLFHPEDGGDVMSLETEIFILPLREP